MIGYLTRNGFPEDFAVLIGVNDPAGCDLGGRQAFFFPRPLVVETALVENTSEHVIEIGQFFGGQSGDMTLRKTSYFRTTAGGAISRPIVGNIKLEVGGRALLVTRLLFPTNSALEEFFNKQKREKPNMSTYAYGPELNLTGVSIDGEDFSLDGTSANFISLTGYSDERSCPLLYAWDDKLGDWVNHDKILHDAHGPTLVQTEERSFAGLRTIFRISEEEAEISFIHSATLRVELNNGNVFLLLPDIQSEGPTTLLFGQEMELNFSVSKDITVADVKSSTLSITGNYERYSDHMTTAGMYCPVKSKTPISLPLLRSATKR